MTGSGYFVPTNWISEIFENGFPFGVWEERPIFQTGTNVQGLSSIWRRGPDLFVGHLRTSASMASWQRLQRRRNSAWRRENLLHTSSMCELRSHTDTR
jgi:hypothetical protein